MSGNKGSTPSLGLTETVGPNQAPLSVIILVLGELVFTQKSSPAS